MAFINAPSIILYVATTDQTVFDFGFKYFNDTDISVRQSTEGVALDPEYTLDPSLYTITPTGDNIGGTITLNTGAVDKDNIAIIRSLPAVRTVEYSKRGDLLSSTLNEDQDYQTYLLQDFEAQKKYFVTTAPGTVAPPKLPAAEPLAFIQWDDEGKDFQNNTDILDSVDTAVAAAAAAEQSYQNTLPIEQEVIDQGNTQVARVITEGDTQTNNAQLKAWDAEAEALTADSYANEPEDVNVKQYTSNNDGTFLAVSIPGAFSSLHWSIKSSQVATGLTFQSTWDMSAGQYPTTQPPEGTGTPLEAGDFFVVDTAGTTPDLIEWLIGDWAILNAALEWTKYPNVVEWNAVINVPQDISLGYNPVGAIIMFNGLFATIPTNWQLCDGTNGTPDLTDKFIRGTSVEADIGNALGSDTAALPIHAHASTAASTLTGITSTTDIENADHSHVNTAASTFAGAAMAAHNHTGAGASTFAGAAMAAHNHTAVGASTFTGTALPTHTHQVGERLTDGTSAGGDRWPDFIAGSGILPISKATSAGTPTGTVATTVTNTEAAAGTPAGTVTTTVTNTETAAGTPTGSVTTTMTNVGVNTNHAHSYTPTGTVATTMTNPDAGVAPEFLNIPAAVKLAYIQRMA